MHECTFVILGATGDLAKRKLIPAIYKLIRDNKVKNFAIVGVGLEDVSVEQMLTPAKEFIKKLDEGIWSTLAARASYYSFDFYEPDHFIKLRSNLEQTESQHGLSGNRMFYLATMPEHFSTITQQLAAAQIVHKGATTKPWARIVYEKPFGHDLPSARAINESIAQVFTEEQVYRIDHYLGKELVGNIALARFTNRVFEPLWNNENIESVQIVLSEKIGIENRGVFYEKAGALRDMVQSHMLQMVALVAMEAPKELSGHYIRDAKAAVLATVKPQSVVLGQYEGYKDEEGVSQSSTTETFAAIKLAVDNKRWQGVPFYLKTGKHMPEKTTAIHIKFKPVKCLLSKACPSDTNYLTFEVFPEAGFYLELNAKVPGVSQEVVPVKMEFCHSCLFGPNTPEAYETLLHDVIRGDQSVFVRSDEIEDSWKIVDEIKSWDSKVYPYKPGASGPDALGLLDDEVKVRWRS